MLPKLNTGLFLSLCLLLSRKAEAETKFFEPGFICFDCSAFQCCLDNTWDIALSDPLAARQNDNLLALEEPREHHPQVETESFYVSLPEYFQPSADLSLRNPYVKCYSGDFSIPLFHPPTNY